MKREAGKKEKENVHKQSVLIVTTLSAFLTPLALSTVNVALPSIGGAFSMNAIALSWVATAYLLTAAMFLLPFGKLADIYGRKRIFYIGTWVFTISSFLLGFSPSGGMLIAFRAIQGIGGAMLFGTGNAILSSVFPAGERGRVFGINVAAVYLGNSFGPFLGGIITHHMGWRWIFFLNIPFGLTIILLSLLKLKTEWADAQSESFDYVGSFVYSLSFLAIIYALSLLPFISGWLFIVSGLLGIAFFIKWEAQTEHPIIHVRLFNKNRIFIFSNIAALINYSATFVIGFLLSFYLQHIRGFTPQRAGIILVSQPIIQAIFSPFAGKISDRVEPRIVASGGMLLTAMGLFLLACIKENTPLMFIIMNLGLLGLGFAFFSSPNTNAIMSSVENRFYGVASATLATMRLLGQIVSMGIAMALFAIYMGRVEIVPLYYPQLLLSIKVTFTVCGFLCIGGIFASLIRGNLR